MWNFDPMILLDLACYATAAAIVAATFRALDYAEDRRGRHLTKPSWSNNLPAPAPPSHVVQPTMV